MTQWNQHTINPNQWFQLAQETEDTSQYRNKAHFSHVLKNYKRVLLLDVLLTIIHL